MGKISRGGRFDPRDGGYFAHIWEKTPFFVQVIKSFYLYAIVYFRQRQYGFLEYDKHLVINQFHKDSPISYWDHPDSKGGRPSYYPAFDRNQSCNIDFSLGPLLLTWFNFNPSMDK